MKPSRRSPLDGAAPGGDGDHAESGAGAHGDGKNQEFCAICREALTVEGRGTLQCGHHCCFICILTWSKKCPICPLCRAPIKSIRKTLTQAEVGEKKAKKFQETAGGKLRTAQWRRLKNKRKKDHRPVEKTVRIRRKRRRKEASPDDVENAEHLQRLDREQLDIAFAFDASINPIAPAVAAAASAAGTPAQDASAASAPAAASSATAAAASAAGTPALAASAASARVASVPIAATGAAEHARVAPVPLPASAAAAQAAMERRRNEQRASTAPEETVAEDRPSSSRETSAVPSSSPSPGVVNLSNSVVHPASTTSAPDGSPRPSAPSLRTPGQPQPSDGDPGGKAPPQDPEPVRLDSVGYSASARARDDWDSDNEGGFETSGDSPRANKRARR